MGVDSGSAERPDSACNPSFGRSHSTFVRFHSRLQRALIVTVACCSLPGCQSGEDSVPPPALILSTELLNFGMQEEKLSLRLTNEGGGTLTWDASSSSLWITTISPESGSLSAGESSEISVHVGRSALTPGTHEGSIELVTNGAESNGSVTVNIEVPDDPTLAVTPLSLDFGPAATFLTLSIDNVGHGTLHWSGTTAEGWIAIVPPSDSTNFEIDQVPIVVSRSGLTPGFYTGAITISPSVGDPVMVSVTMEVPLPPTLSVMPLVLDFETTYAALPLNIQNAGTGTLRWSVDDDQAWLTVIPTTGSTTTEVDQVTVAVNRSGFAQGTYFGTVTVTPESGSPAAVSVEMGVPPPPTLFVAPTLLGFGTDLISLTFNVQNVGSGVIPWSITANRPWIVVSPTSGTTSAEVDEVTVSVSRFGLGPGTYNGVVTVTPGIGAPTGVSISMEVPAPPTLWVTPLPLDFGTAQTNLSFAIRNAGTGTLSWSTVPGQAWITVNPTSGSIVGDTQQVAVLVDRSALSPGSYTGEIVISSNGGSATVGVALDVTMLTAEFAASPRSGYEPLSVNFVDLSEPGRSPITSWAWAFGSGATSSERNPRYTYTEAGTYTVSLTVTNSHGSDSETKTDYIRVDPASAGLLLADDFDDGVIDQSKWSTPYGGVSESGGNGSIFDRGYWITLGEYDLFAGPIEMTCDVRVLVAWDFLTVAVRSDGVKNLDNYGEVMNGLDIHFFREFYAESGFSVGVRNHINGTLGPTLLGSSPHLSGTTDEWWTLRIRFDQTQVSIWLNDEFAGTVAYGHDHPYGHVALYNRGWPGQTILIDNVRISRVGK